MAGDNILGHPTSLFAGMARSYNALHYPGAGGTGHARDFGDAGHQQIHRNHIDVISTNGRDLLLFITKKISPSGRNSIPERGVDGRSAGQVVPCRPSRRPTISGYFLAGAALSPVAGLAAAAGLMHSARALSSGSLKSAEYLRRVLLTASFSAMPEFNKSAI